MKTPVLPTPELYNRERETEGGGRNNNNNNNNNNKVAQYTYMYMHPSILHDNNYSLCTLQCLSIPNLRRRCLLFTVISSITIYRFWNNVHVGSIKKIIILSNSFIKVHVHMSIPAHDC